MIKVKKEVLFESQRDGYSINRVPGVIHTLSGVAVLHCESRKGSGGDWDPMDIRMRRSCDGCKTWEEPRIVVDHQNFGTTINNFILIPDCNTGRVCALFCVDYARAFRMFSDDDCLTFSEPEDITNVFDGFRGEYDFKVIAIGPGHGIQLKRGRMIAPIWVSPGTSPGGHRPNRCGAIYSDDGGENWIAGELVPDTLPCCNESEAVELSDGQVMMIIRTYDLGDGVSDVDHCYKAKSYSPDGAGGWSEPLLDKELPDPICFSSVCRLDDDTLVFSNCACHEVEITNWARDRKNLTVKVSRDEGNSWTELLVLEPEIAGYSDLCVIDDGHVLCVYEKGMYGENMCKNSSLIVASFRI